MTNYNNLKTRKYFVTKKFKFRVSLEGASEALDNPFQHFLCFYCRGTSNVLEWNYDYAL